MIIPGAIGKARYHIRLGQIHYCMDNLDKAKDEFIRGYLLNSNRAIRNIGDSKYFELIKPIIEDQAELAKYSTDKESYSFD